MVDNQCPPAMCSLYIPGHCKTREGGKSSWLMSISLFLVQLSPCYELNCIPLKFIYWSSDPQYRWGLWRVDQIKMRPLGWALSQSDWCPYKRKFRHTWRHRGSTDRGKIMWEYGEKSLEKDSIWAKKRGLKQIN